VGKHVLDASVVLHVLDTNGDLSIDRELLAPTLLRSQVGTRTIIAGLIGDMHHNPELAAAIVDQILEPHSPSPRWPAGLSPRHSPAASRHRPCEPPFFVCKNLQAGLLPRTSHAIETGLLGVSLAFRARFEQPPEPVPAHGCLSFASVLGQHPKTFLRAAHETGAGQMRIQTQDGKGLDSSNLSAL